MACVGRVKTLQQEAYLRISAAEVNLSASEALGSVPFAFSRSTVNRGAIHFDAYRVAISFADARGSNTTPHKSLRHMMIICEVFFFFSRLLENSSNTRENASISL